MYSCPIFTPSSNSKVDLISFKFLHNNIYYTVFYEYLPLTKIIPKLYGMARIVVLYLPQAQALRQIHFFEVLHNKEFYEYLPLTKFLPKLYGMARIVDLYLPHAPRGITTAVELSSDPNCKA